MSIKAVNKFFLGILLGRVGKGAEEEVVSVNRSSLRRLSLLMACIYDRVMPAWLSTLNRERDVPHARKYIPIEV